ncbi:MAG: HNH endonuclease [Caulobacteraceae bacterium]
MIKITWSNEESSGFTDLLPDWILSGDGVLVHVVLGPKRGVYQARCRAARTGSFVDLDYEPFPEFNDPRGMFLGVTRLILNGDGLSGEVQWKDPSKTFEGGEAKAEFELGVDLAEYDIRAIERDRSRTPTQKSQLIQARRGQGKFRDGLVQRWGGACAVTGLHTDALLRASHMKPWSASSDDERLDPANGLLLAAHVDALFDRYLITFDEDGTLQWSEEIAREDRERLNLPRELRQRPNDGEKRFLRHHSDVFGHRPPGTGGEN